MNPTPQPYKHKDLWIRALATLGMVLNLFIPFFGIALGGIALGLMDKDPKKVWHDPEFYYALATVVAGIIILFAVITLNLRNSASSSESI